MNVQKFLQDRGVAFDSVTHAPTFDAQRMAQAVGVSGDEVAKTVLLRSEVQAEYVLAVLPATHVIDFEKAAQALGRKRLQLACETEFTNVFPDCEIGAVPPFGSRYGVQTLMDESLEKDEEIVFEGNTHEEAIRMKLRDFVEVEKPVVAAFSQHI